MKIINRLYPLLRTFHSSGMIKLVESNRCQWHKMYIRPTSQSANSNVHQSIQNGPDLNFFLQQSAAVDQTQTFYDSEVPNVPYLKSDALSGNQRKVYFDVYGCQMNVNDTEIAWSILNSNGFQRVENEQLADVILVVTCSIREGAEQKIWHKIRQLRKMRSKRNSEEPDRPQLKIGILGCMAERLKRRLVEGAMSVDVVSGPDSYRDLPRLLALADDNQEAINVQLSIDETYADINPVRLNPNSVSAFVSIMRGCDNMCSYCIVPFTRGRERSRPITSIVEEVMRLSEQGVKEVTLLGQNVNSYRDTSEDFHAMSGPTDLAKGFGTIYKSKKGGLRFSTLLERVAEVDPEMRIRFTSPHPKDFPDPVLDAICNYNNICNMLHLPVQCGNSKVLNSMRRGYTRETYLELVHHIRDVVPDVRLSSDFICGFCGETEEDFEETISLMKEVKYHQGYLFAYSMREKTHAHYHLKDDVPQDVKSRRLMSMVKVYREEVAQLNAMDIGTHQLVLVEGVSKRSSMDLQGRNEGNTKVIFPRGNIFDSDGNSREIKPGDYLAVEVTASNSQVLKGRVLHHTTLQKYYKEDDSRVSRRMA